MSTSNPDKRATFKFKHKEAVPTPPGIPDAEWNKLFSAADSRIYNRSQKDSARSKQARASGTTRLEALEALTQKRRRDPTYYPDPTSLSVALPANTPAPLPALHTTVAPSSPLSSVEMAPKRAKNKAKASTPAVDTSSTSPLKSSTAADPIRIADAVNTVSTQNNAEPEDQVMSSPAETVALDDERTAAPNASSAKPKSKPSHRKRPKNKKAVRSAAGVTGSKAGAHPSGASASTLGTGPIRADLSLSSAANSSRPSKKRSPLADIVTTIANYEGYADSPRSPKTPDSDSGWLPLLPPSPTTPTSRTYEPSIGDDGMQPAQDSDDNASFEGSDDGGTYCICRGPDDHSKMVQCEQCEEWYHIRCIEMKEWWYDLVEQYFCPKCVTTERRCQYKNVCRLDGCQKAARAELIPDGSWKYCSDAHMDKWAERMIAKAPPGTGPSRGGVISRGELKRLIDQNPTAAQFHALGKKPHLKGVFVNDNLEDGAIENHAGNTNADGGSKQTAKKHFHLKKGGGPTKGKWITLAELRKRANLNTTDGDGDGNGTVNGKGKASDVEQRAGTDPLSQRHLENNEDSSAAATDEATQYVVSMDTLLDGRLHDWLGQYLTEEEQMEIHGLNSQREKLSQQRNIFEMKEKLISFVKGKANRILGEIKAIDNRKDICGYDRILGKNEPELDAWLKSDAGIEAFTTGRLVDPVIDASVVDQDQIEGTCIRKRCTSHVQWFKLHMQDTRFEVAELTKQDLKLDQLELAIFETVETRVLLENA